MIDHKLGKDADAAGTIQQESPAGITLKQGMTTKLIPATDIQHVEYRLGDVKQLEYSLPFSREKNALDPKKTPVDRRALMKRSIARIRKTGRQDARQSVGLPLHSIPIGVSERPHGSARTSAKAATRPSMP